LHQARSGPQTFGIPLSDVYIISPSPLSSVFSKRLFCFSGVFAFWISPLRTASSVTSLFSFLDLIVAGTRGGLVDCILQHGGGNIGGLIWAQRETQQCTPARQRSETEIFCIRFFFFFVVLLSSLENTMGIGYWKIPPLATFRWTTASDRARSRYTSTSDFFVSWMMFTAFMMDIPRVATTFFPLLFLRTSSTSRLEVGRPHHCSGKDQKRENRRAPRRDIRSEEKSRDWSWHARCSNGRFTFI